VNLSDLRSFDLDFQNVAGWPIAIKTIAVLIVCAAVLGAGYWFDTQHQLQALDREKQQEAELKGKFETRHAKAINLEGYKQQMVEMQNTFGAMLRQLPSKTEVAGLLVDISQTGLASGLEFELFQPKAESPQEFYAELPINIRVTGTYHEFGNFVSGVAALPRIVTLHDIAIKPGKEKFVMEALAKTYRYIDEDQQQGDKRAAKKGKK